MLEQKQDLSLIECVIESGYTPQTLRTAIRLEQLNAELIKVKNRDTYTIKRTDFYVWLESKGRSAKKAGV